MKNKIDFNLIKILSGFYGIVVLLTFIKRVYFIFQQGDAFAESIDWFDLFFSRTFLDWLPVTLYMIMVSFATKKMFDFNLKFKYILLLHFLFSFIMTWFIYLTASIILFSIGKQDFTAAVNNVSLDHFVRNFDVNFITYFVLAAIIYVYYYIHKMREFEAQKTKLSNQLAASKMQVLKTQLHPHLLFNTLNSISAMVVSNPKQAQNTIADLSDLLREILELKEDNLITLQQEMSLLKKYFDIMLVRFSDHLNIETNIEENLETALIPSMLFQPIVENSFKHGFSFNTTRLELVLNISKKEGNLIIEISNNGTQIEHPINKKGTGIFNTTERLKTLYGNNFEFSFVNKLNNEKGVITKIIIPYKEGELKFQPYKN